MKISLAQINTKVGDINNSEKIERIIDKNTDTNILIFPELAITGYPPKDLLLNKWFNESFEHSTSSITSINPVSIIGTPRYDSGRLYNSAMVGNHYYDKIYLPNYRIFDEQRYFDKGKNPFVFNYNGFSIAVTICEDIWIPEYISTLSRYNIDLLINISASPFDMEKEHIRDNILKSRAIDLNCYVAYCNMVGCQDGILFDGSSCVVDPNGSIITKADKFQEQIIECDIYNDVSNSNKLSVPISRYNEPIVNVIDFDHYIFNHNVTCADLYIPPFTKSKMQDLEDALVFGIRDYSNKNGFNRSVIGLSGGIDSAVVADLAIKALGKQNVELIYMPSRFSTDQSYMACEELTNMYGIDFESLDIDDIFDEYLAICSDDTFGVTEENIQARIRGNILMAYSNRDSSLVLSTGNKSEMAVGYCTLYGDMCGGLNVIGDVYKTTVYELARHLNIPESIIQREPTAELNYGQLDTNSLPPYDVLDRILYHIIDLKMDLDSIKNKLNNVSSNIIEKIYFMVYKNEYKRRQSPPIIRISTNCYIEDRRMPITNGLFI